MNDMFMPRCSYFTKLYFNLGYVCHTLTLLLPEEDKLDLCYHPFMAGKMCCNYSKQWQLSKIADAN